MSRDRANIEAGDIVLLVDDAVPRGQWPLGKIVSVRHSADGLVRTAQLRVRGTVIWRPVTNIVKLLAGESSDI